MAKWKEGALDYFSPVTKPQTVMDMVREFCRKTQQSPSPHLYETLITEEYNEWFKEEGLTVGDLKELADLVYVIYGYALAQGYDLDEAVRRVHENNLGRCIQPDGTVRRRSDGKILKNPDYPKVTLEDLLC